MVGSSIKGNESLEWEWKLRSSRNNNNNNWTRWRRKKAAELEERNKTMFITNFPPHMNSQHLRKICGEFGDVADVYLPPQLSNSGKRFALVRFHLRVQDDASELARRLSLISIGYYHLFASALTRHQKEPFYLSQTRQKTGDLINNDSPQTYANVVVKGGILREDLISALSDCLLIDILSRLPSTKEAIRTGILCKRWGNLWTWLPSLIFDEDQITFPIVDKILSQRRQLKLKKFQVFIYYDTKFESQFINWLRYAISCHVEELNISCEGVNEFVFDQLFFTSSCFIDMRLEGFAMNPTVAISWNKLMSLSISNVKLDEQVIENILSGSPLLETLKLDECYGYERLNISSKSVKNLVFSRYYNAYPSLSHIIAPNILSLTIQPYLASWTPTWLNVPSLVEANLDYRSGVGYSTSSIRKKILKSFILNLSHVEELIIGASCFKVLSRLEAKGFVFPSNLRIPEDYERVEYDNLSSDSDDPVEYSDLSSDSDEQVEYDDFSSDSDQE